MRKVFIILAVLFSICSAANAQTLPAKVENFLKKNYPSWEIGKSWVVDSQPRKAIGSGDFNGDGKTDYAVLITKDDRIYAIALLARNNSYKAFNLLAQNRENRWIAGIDVAPKGSEVSSNSTPKGSDKTFQIKNDGIEIYDGERHGQIFYWQSGKFLMASDF